MDPITMAALGLGTSVVGGLMNSSAQSGSNAANMSIMANQQQWNRDDMHWSAAESEKNVGLAEQYNSNEAQTARDFSAAQAQKEMDFQNQMSSTSYQRSMADMKAAGLNPMLAYMKGGASTPGGAMGSSPSPTAPMPSVGVGNNTQAATMQPVGMDILQKGVSTAMDMASMVSNVKKQQADIKNTEADTAVKQAQAGFTPSLLAQQLRSTTSSADAAEARLPAIRAQADYDWKKTGIDSLMLGADAVLDRVGKGMGIATPLLKRGNTYIKNYDYGGFGN